MEVFFRHLKIIVYLGVSKKSLRGLASGSHFMFLVKADIPRKGYSEIRISGITLTSFGYFPLVSLMC